MSDRGHIRWRQLRLGLITTTLLVSVALAVFFVDEIERSFVSHYTLSFNTLTTQDIRVGTPVWLAGQPVGRVRQLKFEPPNRAADERLRVVLAIQKDAQPLIREGSRVQIITAGRLGRTVVDILPFPRPTPPIPAGGQLRTADELDLPQVIVRLRAIRDSLGPTLALWDSVRSLALNGDGTLPRFLRRPEEIRGFEQQLDVLGAVFLDLSEAADQLAAAVEDPATRAALQHIGTRVPELRSIWRGGGGSLGALSRDAQLARRLSTLGSRMAALQARMDEGRGSLGRFLNDRALLNEWRETRAVIDSLKAELRGMAVGSAGRR